MTQFDFTVAKTFCRHVRSWEILSYRVVGLVVFYVLSYLRSPGRFVRLVNSIFQSRFQPRSLFEQRIYDFIVRTRRTLFAKKQSSSYDH